MWIVAPGASNPLAQSNEKVPRGSVIIWKGTQSLDKFSMYSTLDFFLPIWMSPNANAVELSFIVEPIAFPCSLRKLWRPQGVDIQYVSNENMPAVHGVYLTHRRVLSCAGMFFLHIIIQVWIRRFKKEMVTRVNGTACMRCVNRLIWSKKHLCRWLSRQSIIYLDFRRTQGNLFTFEQRQQTHSPLQNHVELWSLHPLLSGWTVQSCAQMNDQLALLQSCGGCTPEI